MRMVCYIDTLMSALGDFEAVGIGQSRLDNRQGEHCFTQDLSASCIGSLAGEKNRLEDEWMEEWTLNEPFHT